MSNKVDRWIQCSKCYEQIHLRVWTNEKGTILVEVIDDAFLASIEAKQKSEQP